MEQKEKSVDNFEQDLKRLEEIVVKMERGGVTLEESLKLFKDGVELTKKCQNTLKAAEEQIKILTDRGVVDFDLKS